MESPREIDSGSVAVWRHPSERVPDSEGAADRDDSPEEVSRLLSAWNAGDGSALDDLMPLLLNDLRRLAGSYLRRERLGHTLQPTALVNELYLKLADHQRLRWHGRAHFLSVAARLMRRILVDYARERRACKRGGQVQKVSLDEAHDIPLDSAVELLEVDEALSRLATLDPRQAQVVELRFYGGLTLPEIAEALGLHPATVSRDWRSARAWLLCSLRADA